jgi:hypothetical protein
MYKKVTIYGERCSGTNYLEKVLLLNFDIEIVWDYGWKHFFGFKDLSNSDDVLFIGIIRNLEDWINSLYRHKHHLPSNLTENIDTFLNNTFYSFYLDNTHKITSDEIMSDRNIETKERYKNIFELRYIKNKFLIETMPKLVKNYYLITYDNLCENFTDIMNKICNCGLKIKNNIVFPLNIKYNIKKINEITKEKIKEKIITETKLLFYEKLLFPKSEF